MTIVAYDTLAFSKKLQKAGMDIKTSEIIASEFKDTHCAIHSNIENLATKDELHKEISLAKEELRKDIKIATQNSVFQTAGFVAILIPVMNFLTKAIESLI